MLRSRHAVVIADRVPDSSVAMGATSAMAQTATGRHHDLDAAARALVRTAAEVRADPAWRDRYAVMQPVFDRLYRHSKPLYDDLDGWATDTVTRSMRPCVLVFDAVRSRCCDAATIGSSHGRRMIDGLARTI